MKNTTKAYIAVTCQSLIVGFSFLFVKIALKSADTLSLLAHRFTLAALGILIYNLLSPSKIKVDRSDWRKIAPYSVAYPIAFFLFQTLGLQMISSSEAGIVHATAPVWTLIAAGILLKERVGSAQKLLMLLSVSGVVFINIMNGSSVGKNSYLGFLFILLSAISFAVYTVLTRRLSKTYSVLPIVYVMSITGCVVFNLISVARHLLNGSLADYFRPFSDPAFAWAMLYLGVLSSLVTALLSTYALGKLEASKVGLCNNLSVVVTLLAGPAFLHETLYYYHYISMLAILIGTIGFNLIKIKPRLKDAGQ